ncbi:MAG: energy-coupling factor transporter transmembrane component T [Candidatus Limnocylindrales bacterium]
MIGLAALDDTRASTPLGRASALVKLAVAVVWLLGIVVAPDPRASLTLALIALVAARWLGAVPLSDLVRGLAPLVVAAGGIAAFTAVFAAANADPEAVPLLTLGPIVVSVAGAQAALLVGARLLAIGAISIAFATTTSPTALVDALVQQAHVPDRFAYGALAAYGALPRLSADLRSLREARQLRGLRADLHPRLLVALLVLAVRHAERLGVAMDARGFGRGPRSHFRPLTWGPLDLLVALGGLAILAAILWLAFVAA